MGQPDHNRNDPSQNDGQDHDDNPERDGQARDEPGPGGTGGSPGEGAAGRGPSKRDRAMALIAPHLELRRAEHGWVYARHRDSVLRFEGPGRAALCTEIRYLWHRTQADDPPDDRTLRSVVADLSRLAQDAEVDDAAATTWLAERGIRPSAAPTGGDRGLAAVAQVPGCLLPDGYQVPEPYSISPDAVWVQNPHGGSDRVAWAALAVLRVFTDPEGIQLVELVWLDRRRWRTRIVPRSVAKSGRQLVKELGDAGLPVTEADAKSAERWLAAVEVANHHAIPEVKIARHLGWQVDHAFGTADGTPYDIQGVDPQMNRALQAHHPHGTLSGWQTAIKIAEQHPSVATAVYTGLAACLLRPLGLSSFTVNWGGTSTTGKTTAAQGGLSAWANPDEAAGAITPWSSTVTYYQARLGLAGDGIPVLFDDTQTAKNPQFVSDALYQITQNQGKGRMGDWKTYRWRTIVLSTGERSALSFATHQGISARVLDIAGAPFGRTESAGSDAMRFREGITANYGIAGPAFADKLHAEIDEHGTGRLADRHAALTEIHRQGASDLARRRAPLVAVIRLAAELAHAWGIVPFPSPQDQVWAGLFSGNDPRDNRAELALDVVREYVAIHADRLRDRPGQTPPNAGWIGLRTRVADDTQAIALVPELLRQALDRAGYELDAVIQGWCEMGALHQQTGQRPPYMIGRNLTTKTKCFIFQGELFRSDDDYD